MLFRSTETTQPINKFLFSIFLLLFLLKFIFNARRGALLRNNLVAVVAAGLLGFSKMAYSYEMLIAGRIISGINAGKCSL